MIPATPLNFIVQAANGQVLASWDLSPGATSYIVQRSQDNVTFTTLATVSGSPLATQYLDTTVALGTQYFYQVAASAVGGTSPYCNSQSAIPAIAGEESLASIRLKAQQRADRVNSNFVSKAEWRGYINAAMAELYDMLVNSFEDYFIAPHAHFTCPGNQYIFPLPNGVQTFQDRLGNNYVAQPIYKLRGVDLALNTYPNAYVTLDKYNYSDRNKYIWPNSGSSLYGVFNPEYRMMGSNIEFIPTPSGGQQIRIEYVPRLKELLLDTDTTTAGINGWIEYVIVRAAKYALAKEESDTANLDQQLLFLKERIEIASSNRDAGSPDTISDVSRGPWGNGYGGPGGFNGGF